MEDPLLAMVLGAALQWTKQACDAMQLELESLNNGDKASSSGIV
jgi:hypothetical protein